MSAGNCLRSLKKT